MTAPRHEAVDCGFNGAAPARARNAADTPDSVTARERFNGAAPARARNARTVDAAHTDCMLQRGRARAGAE